MDFGLVAFGTALGAPVPVAEVVGEYTENVERVLAYGYRNVLRSPPDVGLTDLAVDAGRRALIAAGVEAGELDLVVLATADITEYLFWDASSSVAHRLGATQAESVLLTQACASGVACFDVVAGKFATHPGYRTALLIAVNRTCEAYWNRMDTQSMVFSDGAAAAVARRGHEHFRWLTTEVFTDGRYADFYRLDVGGAARPFNTRDVGPTDLRVRDAWAVMAYFDFDAQQFVEYIEQLDERTALVVERACARVSSKTQDLAKVILLGDNLSSMKTLADKLAVPLDRTNLEISLEHGHLGAADQLLCLGWYVDRGQLGDGDRVALVSRGRGMHWACTLVEV